MLMMLMAALESEGDRVKVADLYHKHFETLMKVALTLASNRGMAEDAVQNTFMAAIRHKSKILTMDDINFLKWSVIVVKSKCIDLLRREQRNTYNSLDELADFLPSGNPSIDDQIIQKETHERLIACVAGLDEVSRLIMEMKYVMQMSFKEICVELGYSHSRVNNRLTSARAKIKKQMGGA